MAEKELKPCPFCGGKAEMVTEYSDPFECGGVIYCVDCGAKIEFGCGGEVRLNAVEAWNRRVKDDEC